MYYCITLEEEAIIQNIKTIASYFTKGKTFKEMIDGLKNTQMIFIDEFYQASPFHIQILYYASMNYNMQIRACVDAQQVPSPDDTSVYNLKEHDFINNIFFKKTCTFRV